jgi:hypothetical protein
MVYFERAMDIFEQKLHPNHPDLQAVRKDIEFVRHRLHVADKK